MTTKRPVTYFEGMGNIVAAGIKGSLVQLDNAKDLERRSLSHHVIVYSVVYFEAVLKSVFLFKVFYIENMLDVGKLNAQKNNKKDYSVFDRIKESLRGRVLKAGGVGGNPYNSFDTLCKLMFDKTLCIYLGGKSAHLWTHLNLLYDMRNLLVHGRLIVEESSQPAGSRRVIGDYENVRQRLIGIHKLPKASSDSFQFRELLTSEIAQWSWETVNNALDRLETSFPLNIRHIFKPCR